MKHEDYPVGYGKPPKSSQFKKGKSGNPKGRPKGSRDFNTDLQDVLNKMVPITENGKSKKISAQRATLLRLMEKALAGDIRAMLKAIDLAQDLSSEEMARNADRKLSQTDAEVIERFMASQKSEMGTSATEADDDGS